MIKSFLGHHVAHFIIYWGAFILKNIYIQMIRNFHRSNDLGNNTPRNNPASNNALFTLPFQHNNSALFPFTQIPPYVVISCNKKECISYIRNLILLKMILFCVYRRGGRPGGVHWKLRFILSISWEYPEMPPRAIRKTNWLGYRIFSGAPSCALNSRVSTAPRRPPNLRIHAPLLVISGQYIKPVSPQLYREINNGFWLNIILGSF